MKKMKKVLLSLGIVALAMGTAVSSAGASGLSNGGVSTNDLLCQAAPCAKA